MNSPADPATQQDATTTIPASETRQKALQEELRELVDVVGSGSLVDLLMERAFQLRATDVHFDPSKNGLRIRLRVDGTLHDVLELPPDVSAHVVSRLKLMANMDITERRHAQDGQITNSVLTHQRDVRVGSSPTVHGERLVLRLMPDVNEYRHLAELGMNPQQVEWMDHYLRIPYGMILGVGPVACGKTTTLYAGLELLNVASQSVVTIEDPVERRIDGINQVQVDPRIGFNFVEALRGVLRQDPDVMMVGEIRDAETAHIGVRAGLTGITVLSTLHANDTASSIDVFREFGIPSMFIADSLRAVISQRLLRTVCENCRTTYLAEANDCDLLGLDHSEIGNRTLNKGEGCDRCFQTGHLGRTATFEMMAVDGDIRKAIVAEKPRDELIEIARGNGTKTLEESAREKVLAGVTSMTELYTVLTSFYD